MGERVIVRSGTLGLVLLACLFFLGCAEDIEPATGVQGPFIGTHNSYHIEPSSEILQLVALVGGSQARTALEYTHPPLVEQLDVHGVRSFEFDLYIDDGGTFDATPLADTFGLDLPPLSALPSGEAFRVLHLPEVDFQSRCDFIGECLSTIAEWSERSTDHQLVSIFLELKEESVPGGMTPIQYDLDRVEALNDLVGDVFGTSLIRPSEVTRDEAGRWVWPDLGEPKGRVLVTVCLCAPTSRDLSNEFGTLGPGQRNIFYSTDQADAEADPILIANDPISHCQFIRDAVAQGFLVRTRSDADGIEAAKNDTARLRAAASSGAQIVHTDYPGPARAHASGYFVDRASLEERGECATE